MGVPRPLAECEELVQTDPDGSQMVTNNLSLFVLQRVYQIILFLAGPGL